MNKYTRFATIAGLALGGTFFSHAAPAADCEMKFTMSGWSAFYKRSSGTGHVTCTNGQSATVRLEMRGGGLSAGKSTIEGGHGEFSNVKSLDEIFGNYVSAEAHAGAVKSSKTQVVTKGEVTLALTGTGRGWDLGVAVGKFTIKRK